MLHDQVSCHIFRYISHHDCLLGIIVALKYKQVGKMPQHNHH